MTSHLLCSTVEREGRREAARLQAGTPRALLSIQEGTRGYRREEDVAVTSRRVGRQAPEGNVFAEDVLAGNLRAYRLLHGLQQVHVAERMGSLGHSWTRSTVAQVERGQRNVTVPELVSLTLVIGVAVERLLDPRGPERRKGPRLALDYHGRIGPGVDPTDVGKLVCSCYGDVEVEWDTRPSLREVVFTDPEEVEQS
jgi:transcriptional regulator with XRE-family HTH domain